MTTRVCRDETVIAVYTRLNLSSSGDTEPSNYGGVAIIPWRHDYRPVRQQNGVWARAHTIETSGKKRRDTVLICLSSDDVEEGRIAEV